MSTLAPSYIFFTGKEDLAAESVGDALYKWNFTGRDVQGLFEEIWRLEIEPPAVRCLMGSLRCWSVDGKRSHPTKFHQNSPFSVGDRGGQQNLQFILGLYQLAVCAVLFVGSRRNGEVQISSCRPFVRHGEEFERRWSLEEDLGRKADKDRLVLGAAPFFLAADRSWFFLQGEPTRIIWERVRVNL